MVVTILYDGHYGLSSNKLILCFWHFSRIIAEQILQNNVELPRVATVPWCRGVHCWNSDTAYEYVTGFSGLFVDIYITLIAYLT